MVDECLLNILVMGWTAELQSIGHIINTPIIPETLPQTGPSCDGSIRNVSADGSESSQNLNQIMQIDPSLCNNKNVATSSSSPSTSSFTLDSFGSAAPPPPPVQSEPIPKIPPAAAAAAPPPPPAPVAVTSQQPVVITVSPLPATAPLELPGTGAAPAASISGAQIVNMAGAQLIKVVAAAPLTNPNSSSSSSSVIETTPLPVANAAAAAAYTVPEGGGTTQGPAATTTVVYQTPNVVQRLDEGHHPSGESLGIVAPRVFNLVTTNQKSITTTLPAPKSSTFNNGQQRIATVTALPTNARVIPASTVQTPSGQKVQILGNVVVAKQNILLNNKTLAAPQRQLITTTLTTTTTTQQSKPLNNNNNPPLIQHKPQLAAPPPQVKTIKTISRQPMAPHQQQQLQSPQKTIKTLSPQSPGGGGYSKQGIKTLSPQNNHQYTPKNQLKLVQANRIGGGIKTIAPQRTTSTPAQPSRPPPQPTKTNYIGKHAAQAQKSHATKSRVAHAQGQQQQHQQRLNHSPKYHQAHGGGKAGGGGNHSQSNFNQSLTAQILQSLPSVGGGAAGGRTMPLNNEHMYHGAKNHSMQSPTEVGEEISPEISPNLNYIHQVIMLDHNYHAMPPEDTPPTHRQSQQNQMNGLIPSAGQSASYYGSVAASSKRHGRHPSTSVTSQSNLQQQYHHQHHHQPQSQYHHHSYHPQSLVPSSNQPPSSHHHHHHHPMGKTSQLAGGPVLPDRSQPVDDDAASTISSDAGNDDNRFDVDEGEETETAAEGEGDEEGVTKCICDFDHDDGFMICCDICSSWQHVECMGFTRDTIPEKYSCVRCVPRRVDRAQARAIQQRKREEFARIAAENAAALPASVTTAANSGSISDSSSDTSTAESTGGDGPASHRNHHSVSLNNNLVGKKRGGGTPVSVAARRKSEPVRRPLAAHKRQQRRDSARETSVTTPAAPPPRRTMKKREKKPLMKRKMKSRSSVDDDSQDSWPTAVPTTAAYSNMGASLLQLRQWIENYEEAVTNHYSPELRARINNMRANGVSYNNNQQPDKQAPANAQAEVAVQKCKVASQPLTNIKIVMSTQTLAPNAPVIELMGKYMLSTQHRTSTGPPGTTDRGLLTRQHSQRPGPFLFFYRLPRDGTEVCVDTRTYGNDARFIRRSCKPNAELRHCVEKGTLHLYVITLSAVDKNSELTIKHESHDLAAAAAAATTGTPVQIPCACGNPQQCGLVTNHRKNGGSAAAAAAQKNNLPQETTTNATVSNTAATENSTTTHRKRRGRRASSPIHRPTTPPPAPAPPAPKITSPPTPLTSPVAAQQPLPSPIPPPIVPAPPPALSTRRASSHVRAPREPRHSISSDHDEAPPSSTKPDKTDSSKDKDKKLTREERKMEAIMKAFERLEKQEQRKQEQSARQAQRKETDPIPGSGSTTTGRGDDTHHHGNVRQNHQNGEVEREGVRTRRKKRKGRSRTISATSQTSLNRRRTRLNSTDSYLTSDEGSLLSPPLPMPTTPAPEPTTTTSSSDNNVRSSSPDLPSSTTKQPDQSPIKTTTTTPPMTSPVKAPTTAPPLPIGDLSSPGQINTAAGLLLALANGGAGAASTSTEQPQTVMAEPNIINKSPETDSNSSGSNSSLLSSPLTPTLSSACLLVAAALGPVESSGFKFPKTEYKTEYKTKKAIMNHWLNKSPELTLAPQPIGHDATAEPSSDYYNNNNSATAMLTATTMAAATATANKGLATLVQAASLCDSPPQCTKVQGAGGNAKKRWLRQAMAVTAEELESSPCSPSGSPPLAVAAEMVVAPPKKRRLARASLSSEQSFTPPSTPTMLVPPAHAMADEDYHNNDEEFYQEDRTHSEFQKAPALLLKDPVAERLELLYSGLNHQSPPLPPPAALVVPGAQMQTVNQMRAELDCVDSAVAMIKEPRDLLEYETLKRDGLMDTLTNKFPDTLNQMMDPRLGRDRPIFRDSSQLIGTLEKTIRFYEENLTGPIPQTTTPAPLESPQPSIPPIPPLPQPIIHEEPVCIPIVPPPAVIPPPPPPSVVTPLVSVVAPVPPAPPVDTSPVPVLAPPKFKLQGKPEMVTPAKRKLSISEYRQRKQLTTPANEKGSGVTTPERSVSPETTPAVTTLAAPVASVPTTSTTRVLPIPRSRSDSTSSTTSSLSSDEELPNVSTAEIKIPAGGEPQVLVAFNSAPTAVELQRENVERLKKAFGLALDDESKKRDTIPRDISPMSRLSPSTATSSVAAQMPLLLNTSQPAAAAADSSAKTELSVTSKFISSLDTAKNFPVKRPLSPEPYGRDSPAIKSPRIDLVETAKDDEKMITATAEVNDTKKTEVEMMKKEEKVKNEETRAVAAAAAAAADEDDEVQFDEDSFIPPFNNPVYPNSTQFTSYPSVIDSSPYEGRNPSPPPSELLQISK